MQTLLLQVPTLFGDHHVVEVRRLLLALPGVESVYASSAFQVVEVIYDPEMINDLDISMKLDEAGYLGEWSFPIELGFIKEDSQETDRVTRHTVVYESIKQGVSFSQSVGFSGRPLWNCPGVGVVTSKELIRKMEE